MPISYKHKAIFVHIPKTAGTSIERALEIKALDKEAYRHRDEFVIGGVKYALQHYTAEMLMQEESIRPHWKPYYKFAFVRHPYTRVLSEYFWIKGKKDQGLEFDRQDFKDHLKSYYANLNTDHKLSQTQYLYSSSGILLVDRVFKFEQIKASFRVLSNRLKLKSELEHAQKSSNSTSYTSKLDGSDKDFIYKLYKKDFENFNYKK
jgi:chondroitin 4-sulfotransferase 11